jgi:hypothetical protein
MKLKVAAAMPLCPTQVQNLQSHNPALFCPFSPEAVLLTGKRKIPGKETIASAPGSVSFAQHCAKRGNYFV